MSRGDAPPSRCRWNVYRGDDVRQICHLDDVLEKSEEFPTSGRTLTLCRGFSCLNCLGDGTRTELLLCSVCVVSCDGDVGRCGEGLGGVKFMACGGRHVL